MSVIKHDKLCEQVVVDDRCHCECRIREKSLESQLRAADELAKAVKHFQESGYYNDPRKKMDEALAAYELVRGGK